MGRKRKTFEEFVKEAILVHGNKYSYDNTQYVGANIKTNFICKEHGHFSQTPNVHLRGHGCPECGVELQSRNMLNNNEYFIERSNNIHDGKYSYTKTHYKGNRKGVVITCPYHGDFEQIARYHLEGNGCPQCSESKGEKKIKNILLDKNIKFIRQKRFDDCRDVLPLAFDFYLPQHSMLIEFDGRQHFEPINHWGGVEVFNKVKNRDSIKEKYARTNNIKLIRIKYDQISEIDSILMNNL